MVPSPEQRANTHNKVINSIGRNVERAVGTAGDRIRTLLSDGAVEQDIEFLKILAAAGRHHQHSARVAGRFECRSGGVRPLLLHRF